ncbi:MAG: fasciclin domain-containing protein [Haloechinothrix sp.]
MRMKRLARVVGGIAVGGMVLAGCGMGDDPDAGPEQTPAEQETTEPANGTAAAGEQFGPACAAVPEEGAGSFEGMAKDPVATAASNNPVLSTLVTAVQEADLVDTLNSAEDITVFAPTNDAFAKIPEADLEEVLADKETLTSILTYHVVGEKITPAQLASGNFETLQGGTVETSGTGEEYQVNDANVVCGNVQTGNATVYIIDTVMMPMQ